MPLIKPKPPTGDPCTSCGLLSIRSRLAPDGLCLTCIKAKTDKAQERWMKAQRRGVEKDLNPDGFEPVPSFDDYLERLDAKEKNAPKPALKKRRLKRAE